MMPLTMAQEGQSVAIRCVDCGDSLTKRLTELGLYDNSIVKVVRNDISGPVILEAKNSRLVLGRGQATKIFIKEVTI